MPGLCWLLTGVVTAASCHGLTEAPQGRRPTLSWKLPYDESPFVVEPVLNATRDAVYHGTPDGTVMKARASNGSVVWSHGNGPPTGSPNRNLVLAGGNAILASTDLFAFDTATGTHQWTYAIADDEVGRNRIETDGEIVFAGAFSGKVYAIDSRTGVPRWITDLARAGVRTAASLPTLSHGLVYVCTREALNPLQGAIWALEATTGAVRWSYRFSPQVAGQGSSCFGTAGHAGDVVIQAQDDGRVYGFDALTGEVRWTAARVHKIPTPDDMMGSWDDIRRIGSNGRDVIVLSGATGIIVSLDPATGAERWRVNPFGGGMGYPVLTDDRAYIQFGGIYAAIDLTTGKTIWQDPDPELHRTTKYASRAAIGTDRIFVGGYDGLYAIPP